MITNPIIPIWLMVIICIGLLLLKRKGNIPYIRQIIIVVLIFVINLRIMVPDDNAKGKAQQVDANVVFVIDDTISMLARDYDGDTERLTAVKEDCSHIIDELYGAKFSIITYHNRANLLSPFTDDADYAKSVIKAISPLEEFYARGSSMNVCKEMLIDTLENASEKKNGNVVVFFISDGEITNDDTLGSFADAAEYIDYGAVLGYGTTQGGKMYVQSYDGRSTLVEDTSEYPFSAAISKIDEDNLEEIAEDMEIDYVHMTEGDSIDKVLTRVKKASKVEMKDTVLEGYKDIYYIFVVPLVLLLIYEFVEYRRRV